MNRLSLDDRARILSSLVEGNSIRATCRMTGAAKGTVLKLLADVGCLWGVPGRDDALPQVQAHPGGRDLELLFG